MIFAGIGSTSNARMWPLQYDTIQYNTKLIRVHSNSPNGVQKAVLLIIRYHRDLMVSGAEIHATNPLGTSQRIDGLF